MINDLIEKLTSTHGVQCLAFAEDIAIFSTDQNIATANKNINIAMNFGEVVQGKPNDCEHRKNRAFLEGTCEKGEKRLSLLKRLAGVTWGSSDVFPTTYKSYVRPVLDYGGELLAIASKSCDDIRGV
ncbi:reverse transcriptase domain-containing protein [Trichonephila inaurata madagascariensis]|uniref:Reverse transcriptase domain-containing protein n=1 Tax=Trichonephila inaurata madagascariensis TaxID=2747483 RepID=A0A8X6II92_9ARAC|nr:reverse transcriptase domain-containing protein [Trichonephila inaurata madagascariensis]